jgi:hypothetical protein
MNSANRESKDQIAFPVLGARENPGEVKGESEAANPHIEYYRVVATQDSVLRFKFAIINLIHFKVILCHLMLHSPNDGR